MRPGDILEYRCPTYGIVWQWRVRSVCLGATKQESLIEVSPVMASEGETTDGKLKTVWVPEPMTRHLKIVAIGEDGIVEDDDPFGIWPEPEPFMECRPPFKFDASNVLARVKDASIDTLTIGDDEDQSVYERMKGLTSDPLIRDAMQSSDPQRKASATLIACVDAFAAMLPERSRKHTFEARDALYAALFPKETPKGHCMLCNNIGWVARNANGLIYPGEPFSENYIPCPEGCDGGRGFSDPIPYDPATGLIIPKTDTEDDGAEEQSFVRPFEEQPDGPNYHIPWHAKQILSVKACAIRWRNALLSMDTIHRDVELEAMIETLKRVERLPKAPTTRTTEDDGA